MEALLINIFICVQLTINMFEVKITSCTTSSLNIIEQNFTNAILIDGPSSSFSYSMHAM